MSWDEVCNYVFNNMAQVTNAIGRVNSQQICDRNGCFETSNTSPP